MQERIASAEELSDRPEVEVMLRDALVLARNSADLQQRLAGMLFRRTAKYAASDAWTEAASSGWRKLAVLPDEVPDLGADIAALASAMEERAAFFAKDDPILATNLALTAWGLFGKGRRAYPITRSLFVHLGTGELGKAIEPETFEQILANDPKNLVALLGLSNVRRRAGALDTAEALCRIALQHWTGNPFAEGRLACVLAEQGRLHAADRLYQKVGATFGGVEAIIRLASTFIKAVNFGADTDSRTIPLEPLPKETLVVCAGCDSTYFHRYADALANSLAKNARRVALHLHVVDPDAAVEQRIAAMRQRLPDLPIRSTVEKMPAGIPEDQRRTYYACARFLHLPRLLATYRLPVLVLDVDAIVLKDLAPLRRAFEVEEADFALVIGQTKDPWCTLWADAVLLAPSARALTYAQRVRAYINHFLARSEAAWFLDQIALYAVWAAGFRDEPAPTMIAWPTDLQNTTTSRAYFWSLHMSQPTNADSPTHPFYRRYQENAI